MKKSFMLFAAIGLCLVFAASAVAFEGGSLENQTTFNLYDRNDPFDLSVDPALLYQVERWRLYTNLSNYEGYTDYPVRYDDNSLESTLAEIEELIEHVGLSFETYPNLFDLDLDPELDGSYYMIGTSGRWGAGSLALFFETNKRKADDDASDYLYDGYERPNPDRTPPGDQYTHRDDVYTITQNTAGYEMEQEGFNVLASYSMDFGIWSLGLAIEPEYEDTTYDLSDWLVGVIVEPGEFFGLGYPGLIGGLPGFGYDWTGVLDESYPLIHPGLNHSWSQDSVTFGNVSHTTSYTESEDVSFDGDEDTEDRNWKFNLGSQIRPADQYEIDAHVTYENMDRSVDGDATYSYMYREFQSGANSAIDPGDFGVLGFANEYSDTTMVTSNWKGAFTQPERDGDTWGLEIRPTYHLNDIVTLDLLLAYEWGDGDLDGSWTQTVNYRREFRDTTGGSGTGDVGPDAVTQVWNDTQTYHNNIDGDWDSSFYRVEPRVYLTYGRVLFSLGVGYSNEDYDADWTTKQNAEEYWSYIDGDAEPSDPDDFAGAAYATSQFKEGEESEVTTWSFPVACEFGITEKLTIRAGARFSREKVETEYDFEEAETKDIEFQSWETNGDGSPSFHNAPGFEPPGAGINEARTPYDPNQEQYRFNKDEEETIDRTDYRLGLGYQATENLGFDLMFAGSDADNGGVDTRTVWASVVLAF